MKRFICFFLLFAVLLCPAASAEPLRDGDISISAPSAILMEKYTGEVLYEKNAHERIFPASVTKVMTMLLIVEDIESGKLHVFDTATFTVGGATLTSYLADVDTDANYEKDTEVVADGYFHESEKRSAPYFDVDIDGITKLNAAY